MQPRPKAGRDLISFILALLVSFGVFLIVGMVMIEFLVWVVRVLRDLSE